MQIDKFISLNKLKSLTDTEDKEVLLGMTTMTYEIIEKLLEIDPTITNVNKASVAYQSIYTVDKSKYLKGLSDKIQLSLSSIGEYLTNDGKVSETEIQLFAHDIIKKLFPPYYAKMVGDDNEFQYDDFIRRCEIYASIQFSYVIALKELNEKKNEK